jgi:hypothetical protein
VARTLPPSWERLQWGTLVQTATWAVWDYDSWLVLSSRDVEVARVSGALTPLSIFLSALASAATVCGDFGTAASLVAERAVVKR